MAAVEEMLRSMDSFELNRSGHGGWRKEDVTTKLEGIINRLIKDESGWMPLSLAAEDGHEAVIKLLLDIGNVNPNVRDQYGWTPLELAAISGHETVVKLLLNSGKIELKGKYGRRVLALAVRFEHKAIAKLLLDTGEIELDAKDVEEIDEGMPLLAAAAGGYEGVVKLLLGTGKVDLDAKDRRGRTPLSLAAASGQRMDAVILGGRKWA
ncbi:hypothetical protein DL762_001639 [Monosporascus cannonballus]|uniref:Ankyrin n=1 Tax=Monosporascus cannonballus TaxID=155416 RepID=A0ABY0HFV5_9PEZI|nr:hypothetical protein DL762_001639 [Monosporascus cannonballus]